MAKKAYIVITHLYTPNPESKSTRDKMIINENIEFVDQIKNRMISEATAIIDYKNKKLKKNRVEHATYQSYINYVAEKYPAKFRQFKEVVDKEQHNDHNKS